VALAEGVSPRDNVPSVDEAWIEAAIQSYQRLERLTAEFEKSLSSVEVTVSSPDGLVEVLVGADGSIRDVTISDDARGLAPRDLARSVQAAVADAANAAVWARQRIYRDTFSEFRGLGDQ
jgi:DNA-binding protein YbaB